MAFAHSKYRKYFQLIVMSGVWRPLRLTAFYPGWALTLFASHGNSGSSGFQERELVSTFDGYIVQRAFSLTTNPSLYLDRAALHLNLCPYRSFPPTYRNYAARHSKSGVYAEVVCRKCGERTTEERQPHMDTSTAPVGPLLPRYAHSPVDLCV